MDGPIENFETITKLATRILLATLAFVALAQITGLGAENAGLSWFLFLRQDVPAIALLLMLLILLGAPSSESSIACFKRFRAIPCLPALGAVTVIAICWIGHYAIFQGYDLSRDEQLANFDAWIQTHGRLFWSLPAEWRGTNANALNLMFMLPLGNHEGWVSNYLPVNAMLRTLVGAVATPTLTGPLLTGVGFLALWDVVRRVWPGKWEAPLIGALFYVASGQILFTGMTTYAMPGHLTFNLVWLALFLRNRIWSHGTALLVGFFATGLHQPIFHPLFVAPLLLMLVWQKRYRLLAFYGVGYATIGLFWFVWPLWLSAQAIHPAAADAGGGISFVNRVLAIVSIPDVGALWLVALNVLRLVSWQHLLFLPLLITGLGEAWRQNHALPRALALGLLMPLPLLLVLLPYQGHGWGYRYLHGMMGNAILLCIYGWFRLGGSARLARPMLLATTTTLALSIPFHGWQIRQMIKPYAEVDAIIRGSTATYAVVDESAAPFASDLVINKPDLSNRPIRLLLGELTPDQLAAACRGGLLVVNRPVLAQISRHFGLDEDRRSHRHDKVCS